MRTVIKSKELGNIEIITQQYTLGLYVAVYKDKRLIDQFGTNLKEAAYHRILHIRAIKKEILLLKEMLSKLKVTIQ